MRFIIIAIRARKLAAVKPGCMWDITTSNCDFWASFWPPRNLLKELLRTSFWESTSLVAVCIQRSLVDLFLLKNTVKFFKNHASFDESSYSFIHTSAVSRLFWNRFSRRADIVHPFSTFSFQVHGFLKLKFSLQTFELFLNFVRWILELIVSQQFPSALFAPKSGSSLQLPFLFWGL